MKEMSAPRMNTVPPEAGNEIHTQDGSREPSEHPGTGWAVGRWSLAGSRGPTWGDQGPRRAGRGLESWGHFFFLRSPAGCSCLLLVPCPSLWLSGFVEAELKKLLVVQRESRLWKMGSYDGRELLTQPEITLEEAGVVDGQVHPPTHHPALPAGAGSLGLETSPLRRLRAQAPATHAPCWAGRAQVLLHGGLSESRTPAS